MLQSRATQRLILSATLLLFAWLAIATLYNAFNEPMAYDDAYNASVARNIADGMGWVTDYHTIIPLNTTVTTGPSLLLPAALLIKIMGPQLWIPPVTNALLMLTVLLVAGIAFKRLISDACKTLALVFTTLAYYSLFDHRVWSEFAGDGLIAMSVLAAATLASLAYQQRAIVGAIGAGILLAVAMMSKLYALISVAGYLSALLWHSVRQYLQTRSIQTARIPMALAAGGLPLLLLWHAYKASVMGAMPDHVRQGREVFSHAFFVGLGSGLDRLMAADNVARHLWTSAQRNFHGLAASLDLPHGTALLTMLVLVPPATGILLLLRRALTGAQLAAFLLAGAVTAHWLWFIFISPGDVRYARIPVLLSIVLLALLLSLRLRGIPALVSVLVLALILPSSKYSSLSAFLGLQADKAETIVSQHAFLKAISSGDPREPLVGCNWSISRLADYAGPREIPLKDLALILKGAVDASGGQPASEPISLRQPIVARLAVSRAEWSYGRLLRACPIADFVEQACNNTLFSHGMYAVDRCYIDTIPVDVANTLRQSDFFHLSGLPWDENRQEQQ